LRSNGRVKVGGKAKEGVVMRGGRREGGEESAKVVDGDVVEPSRWRDGVKKVRSGKGPELSVVVEGKLRGRGVRVEE